MFFQDKDSVSHEHNHYLRKMWLFPRCVKEWRADFLFIKTFLCSRQLFSWFKAMGYAFIWSYCLRRENNQTLLTLFVVKCLENEQTIYLVVLTAWCSKTYVYSTSTVRPRYVACRCALSSVSHQLGVQSGKPHDWQSHKMSEFALPNPLMIVSSFMLGC